MHLVRQPQHFKTVFQRLRGVVNILPYTSRVDKSLLLLGQLLSAGFDAQTQLHDLRCEIDSPFADSLQLLYAGDELLVVVVTYSLDLCFTVCRDMVKSLDKWRDLC